MESPQRIYMLPSKGYYSIATSDGVNIADENLRSTLPRITESAYSILPPLLEVQIELQNALLGVLYTSLQNYSRASPQALLKEVNGMLRPFIAAP